MKYFFYELRIPKERVAVLIGKDGKVKSEVESITKTNIEIDSAEGDVIVKGKDAIALYAAREIIKAIGRGFNPEIALYLIKQDYGFELLSITDFVSENHIVRIKGRVIGKEGKSRRTIENLTETNICVYGKTIGIIGTYDNLIIAKKALESLISGSSHSNVYKFLEKKRRELRLLGMTEKKTL